MAKINFGVHLGFAVNRWPQPEDWARLLSEELGLKHAQFCSDLLQPNFPEEIIDEQADRINESCKEFGIEILHTFTSQRWMYSGHPDKKISDYWLWWLQRFGEISADIGAVSTGSRLGIYGVNDLGKRKDLIFNRIIDNWLKLAEYSKKAGLDCLTFEHMSIPRELAETIAETRRILDVFKRKDPAIPILLCLDTDQGNAHSGNPKDGDPYEWIRAFGREAPVLQLKQRIKGNVSSGKPFTAEFNKEGIIAPDKVLEAIDSSGAREMTLYMEPSFRERLPYDNNVLRDLKESVKFWKDFVDLG